MFVLSSALCSLLGVVIARGQTIVSSGKLENETRCDWNNRDL